MTIKIGGNPFDFDDDIVYASDEGKGRGKFVVDVLIVANGVIWSLILHPYVVMGLKWASNMIAGNLYHFY